MKKTILNSVILALVSFVVSCTQSVKLPPLVSTVEKTKTLLIGKVWQVVDVATIAGSQKSLFDKEQSKNETIVAPAIETLHWLSAKKESTNESDFVKSFYKENLKISIALNTDGSATITGMDAQKKTFSINNDSSENEPKGIKLSLSGNNEAFAHMGAGNFKTTYYILGASETKLYLLTPNKLNDSKVVFLLKRK